MADASLSQSIAVGAFTIGAVIVTAIATSIRDIVQQRNDKKKRRADKFEELVAAVYEFAHWLNGLRDREAFGIKSDLPQSISPFAKVQSITSVYFPQFVPLVAQLNSAANSYVGWIHRTEVNRLNNALSLDGYNEVSKSYIDKHEDLLAALMKFAREEFQ
jgi:hypothetical protein